AGHFDPAVIACARFVRILRLGTGHDALRKVSHNALAPLDLFPGVIAPKHTCQHAAAWHGNVFCATPRRKAVIPPGTHGEGFLPPAVQAFACIGANCERAVPRFAAGFRLLKPRANLLARRDGRPVVSRRSANLEGEGPGENDNGCLHMTLETAFLPNKRKPRVSLWQRLASSVHHPPEAPDAASVLVQI